MSFDDNSPNGYSQVGGADLELAIMTQIFHLRSLHWGYWRKGQELSLEGLRKSQANFTKKILEYLPKHVKTVLDVGCGVGDVAQALATKGIEVTSLSPDPYHKKEFEKIVVKNKRITFVQSKYEDLDIKKRFDLVLMSESCGYFPIDVGLKQTIRYLKPGGYLLIPCMFKKKNMPRSDNYKYLHNLTTYIDKAKENGFELLKNEDVTSQVTPSIEYTYMLYHQYFGPGLLLLAHHAQKELGWKYKVIQLFFKKQLENIETAFTKTIPERLDSDLFKKYATYRFLLFKLN